MEINRNALYDLQELRDIAAGNESFAAEMITLFITDTESALLEINRQIAQKDYLKVKALLHKINPSVKVMGVNSVADIIDKIEKMEVAAMDGTTFSELFSALEKTLREVNVQLLQI